MDYGRVGLKNRWRKTFVLKVEPIFFVIKISSFIDLYINWAISSYLEIYHWCIWNKYGKFKTVM